MKYKEIQNFLTTTMKNAYLQIENVAIKSNFSNNDYVTNCDLIIEKYIIDKIKNTYPDISIMSEELNKQDVNGTYFVVDPIDGTANFSTNLDLWGIQMAYIEDNDCKVSSIYFPKLKFVGDSFIFYNEKINKANLDSLEIINNGFLYYNDNLKYL